MPGIPAEQLAALATDKALLHKAAVIIQRGLDAGEKVIEKTLELSQIGKGDVYHFSGTAHSGWLPETISGKINFAKEKLVGGVIRLPGD